MTERFEDIFKNKLQRFEKNPPEAVFQKLSENQQLFRTGRSFRRNSIIISVSVITIVLLFTIYYTNPKNKTIPTKTQKAEQRANTVLPKTLVQEETTNSDAEEIKEIKPTLVNSNASIETNANIKYYISVGRDTTFCGDTYTLEAHSNIKGFNGRWLCENQNAIIKNAETFTTTVFFKAIGTYQFIFSGFYDQTFFADTLSIMINGIPPENRFMDTTICGNELKVYKTSTINWAETDNINIVETEKKTIHYKSQTYNSHKLVRIALSGSCEFVDSVSVKFTEPNDFSELKIDIDNAYCQQKGVLHISCSENYLFYLDAKVLNDIKNVKLSEGKHILSVLDKNGCIKDIPIEIKKTGNIIPDFSLFSLSNQANTPVYFYNQSTIDDVSFKDYTNVKCFWSFDDGNSSKESNPEHIYKKAGLYNVTLTVLYNDECEKKFQKQIVIKPNSDIQYPNIFSPNGDGNNDIFYVQTKDLAEFKCEIFSSTNGEIIYEWTNPQQGWDGKINGNDDAPEGIYYFVIKGKGKDGKTIIKKSYVYLKR